MKHTFIVVVIAALFLSSCNNGTDAPDVSHIKLNMTTERFEKKLFDTAAPSFTAYLQHLQESDTAFTAIFLNNILNADPTWPPDTTASYINVFLKSYRPVYNDAEKLFKDFSTYEAEIKKAAQFVKYYFPAYKVPGKIITYIGPADGDGDGISEEAFVVGLQYHLGKDNPLYKTELVSVIYPDFIIQTFEPDHISINLMKKVVEELYPEKESDKPLVDQMIEKGKRLYLLSKFLPSKEEFKLIGYTEEQLKDCYKKEAYIWDQLVKNELLQSNDKNRNKNYITEGPTTPELGEGSPGNIGSFAGWQIVKKYMQKNPAVTLAQLMALDDETIFQAAKYKP